MTAPTTPPANPDLLTAKQAARHLRMSNGRFYALARSGELPGLRLGNSWRFTRPSLDAWLAEQCAARRRIAR